MKRVPSLHIRLLPPLLTAVLCVLGPLALPAGPIPITLATLGVYLIAGLLGPIQTAVAVGLYLLLGAVGVPVFSGFSGGLYHLTGPTGGFLLGYVVCALLASGLLRLFRRSWLVPVALAAGTVLLYAVGTCWYGAQTGVNLRDALLICVLPFLPGDAIKLATASALIPPLQRQLKKAMPS